MELPELPERVAAFRCYESRAIAEIKVYSEELGNGDHLFTADQMREYARQAVLAERARCAEIAATNKYDGYVPPEDGNARDYYNAAGVDIAAAIRGEGENR